MTDLISTATSVAVFPVLPDGRVRFEQFRTGAALIDNRSLWDVVFNDRGVYDSDEDRKQATIDNANIVGSAVCDASGKPTRSHRPVLDIDRPMDLQIVRLCQSAFRLDDWGDESIGYWVRSSTQGHGHLYLSTTIPEMQYLAGLMHLAAASVIEEGYALVSIHRRQTFVRLPWCPKVPGQYKGRS